MNGVLDEIDAVYQKFVADAQLCINKGNKAAGVRSRKSSLELAKLMKTWRAGSVKDA